MQVNFSPKLRLRQDRRTTSAAIICALLLSLGCQPANVYEEPPPPTVTVAHPVRKLVVNSLEFTGTTEPINRVDIRARVEGFLESIEFVEGKEVEEGELLFTIDPRPFQAEMAQAEASVKLANAGVSSGEAERKAAIAEVANAEAQLDRAQKAAVSGAITAAEVDVLETAVLTARASVDAADASIISARAQIAAGEALITQAALNLEYAEVRSPIKGRVGQRLVDIGNLVGSGESTVLTNVIQYHPIYAFFTINENDLLAFNRKNLAEPKESDDTENGEMELDQPVFIALGDETGFPHEGRADYADLAVDQSTGTFLIRAVVPNVDRLIPPGAFIRVRVPRNEIEAVLIDEQAIGRDQSGAYLLMVVDGDIVERRNVELTGKFEGMQAVRGNIDPKDRVIVKGIQRARPGAKVTVSEAPPGDQQSEAGDEAPASQDGEE